MSLEKKEPKLSPDQAVNRWGAGIRDDRSSQYLYRDRKEHLELLMTYFIDNDISMEDADTSYIKRKVVETLVHSEGMKDKGKYKDWKKNVETEFDDWIQITYVPESTIKLASKPDYKQDEDIVHWAKSKFGSDIPPQILKECHTIGHSLYNLFVDEFYDRRKVHNG